MKEFKLHRKVITVVAITIFSWLVFPFLTFDLNIFINIIPIMILIIQMAISILFKNRKLLILSVLNPVIFLAIYNTVKPTINYMKGTPTKLKCCYYRPSEPSFDQNELVFLDYYDDDCDWPGLYYYTLDINNIITDGLISIFGNPVRKNNHNDLN